MASAPVFCETPAAAQKSFLSLVYTRRVSAEIQLVLPEWLGRYPSEHIREISSGYPYT